MIDVKLNTIILLSVQGYLKFSEVCFDIHVVRQMYLDGIFMDSLLIHVGNHSYTYCL